MRDIVEIKVESGRGGDGCASFRREKYVPRGGPDGGDGGRGGNIFIRAKDKKTSLDPIRNNGVYRAESGTSGSSARMAGRHGDDLYLDAPPGTVVYDAETGDILGELSISGEKLLVAKGGLGGRGNCHFATPTNRVPRDFEPGCTGQERLLRLEFIFIADAAVIGLPGSGKSSLVGRLTRSRTKVGDYPFTTREVQLGVCKAGEYSFVRILDLPALTEGSCEGKGLGNEFLKHLKRVKLLMFVLDATERDDISPEQQLKILKSELEAYWDETGDTDELTGNAEGKEYKKIFKEIILINKCDLDEKKAKAAQKKISKNKKIKNAPVYCVSSTTGEGLEELVKEIAVMLELE